MYKLTSKDRLIVTFILTLKGIPGIGSKTIQNILSKHDTEITDAVLLDEQFARNLSESKISKGLETDGISWNLLEERADETIENAIGCDAGILHPFMDDYPKRLLCNSSFPPLLFYKGDIDVLNANKAVALIGTRNPTQIGANWGRRLTELLVEDDYVIVSGLAIGSDTVGHQSALNVGGKTVAVLPTPIDAPVYPRKNMELADRILNNGGVLVTEYEPGIVMDNHQLVSNLVARDQWQPGLSDGLIALETSISGGSNHALKHALNTKTPIAMLDYRNRKDIDFYNDVRFGGNVEYISQKGAIPIYDAAGIELFKHRMDSYRSHIEYYVIGGLNEVVSKGHKQLTLNFE